MLFQFLDNLRQKPKPVRNQYAFGFALCSTVIIAGVWSLSLPSRFASLGNTAAVGSATEAASTAPFAGLFNQLKEQFAREGGEPVLMTQDEFAKYVLADVERWRQIVKDIKLQLE